ncbi:MAG TPA: hypothetical protein VFZ36_12785 [Vicinamibacterales bacterium]
MLAALSALLPAVVVGAQQTQAKIEVTIPLRRGPVEAVAGEWTTAGRGEMAVITHDGTKWDQKEGYPLALFREPRDFSAGTVWIDFKLIGGTDDYSAGLVFGHTGGESYYYVRYNTKDGNVALWRMDGPKRTVIKHGVEHAQLAKDEWHRLELTVTGRRIRGAVTGTSLVVEHWLEHSISGRLGLWTKPDVTTAFRNLQVSN